MRATTIWAALVGVAFLAAACTGSASSGKRSSSGKPVVGGTLTFGLDSNVECLDPHQSPQTVAALLSRPIVDSLVAQDSEGGIHPWLASKWHVSADQLTYTFTLRSGVKFSDGTTFDAAAVKANLDHVVDAKTKSLLAASLISSFRLATVIDPATVELKLDKPNSTFLSALATPYLGMESPHSLSSRAGTLCKKIVGSGPFISAEGFTPQAGITYRRNPDYKWGPPDATHRGPAYLAELRVKVVTENASRVGAVTSHQVDAAAAIPPIDVSRSKSSGLSIDVVPTPGLGFSYFPNNQFGVFSDVRVRQALRAGIDWGLIVRKLYFGVYKQARGPLTSSSVFYDASGESAYDYKPTEAARLLDEAGWTGRDSDGYRTKEGKRLRAERLFVQGKDDTVLTSQIQAAAKKLGMQIVDDSVDIGTFVKRDIAGDYDLADTDFASASPDVLRVLFSSDQISSPEIGVSNNVSRYSSPKVDRMLDQALRTTDRSQQEALYHRVQQQITADAGVIPIYEAAYVLGSASRVHGIEFEASSYPTFYDAWVS